MVNSKYSIEDLYAFNFKAFWESFRLESWSFKLICICLVLEYVRPQSMYPVLAIIPWSQILILLTLMITIVNPEKGNKTQSSNFPQDGKHITRLFIVFVGHCFVSSVLAYSPEDSYEQLKVIISWIIFYYLIVTIVNSERRFLVFLALFFLCNLKMSQHGFFAWAGRGFSFSSWGIGGSPGWFSNSGEFGIQMCIFFSLSAATIYAIKPYLSKFLYRILLFVPISAAGSVIASSSRGALLGLIVTLALFLLRGGQPLKKLVIGVFIAALIYLIIPAEFKARFETAGQDTTSVTRLEYWKNGVQMANDHPIFGVGYMNWTQYYRDHYFDADLYRRLEVAHNTFVQAMAELGYVGLFIFLLMCFASFKLNIQTRRIGTKSNNNLYLYLPIGFNIALLGLFVTTFFIAALYYPFYWIHFALTVSLNKAAKDNANELMHEDMSLVLEKEQPKRVMST